MYPYGQMKTIIFLLKTLYYRGFGLALFLTSEMLKNLCNAKCPRALPHLNKITDPLSEWAVRRVRRDKKSRRYQHLKKTI